MRQAVLSNSEGDFVFSPFNADATIVSISEVSGAGFKSSEVLNGKPRQDLSGGKLDQVQITAEAFGGTSAAVLEPLHTLKDADEPVVFIEHTKNRGLWTIKQIRKTKEEIQPNGLTRHIKFAVQLEEFANA